VNIGGARLAADPRAAGANDARVCAIAVNDAVCPVSLDDLQDGIEDFHAAHY
jgi:hypothetical protein